MKCWSVIRCAVVLLAAMSLQAGDIPVEGECGPGAPCPPFTGSVASLTFTGAGMLFSHDFTHAGTFADPWTILVNFNGPEGYLTFTPTSSGGPLTSPTQTNDTGTAHNYGQYIQLTLTNTGNAGWDAAMLELQTTLGTVSNDFDGISFGEQFFPSPPTIQSDSFLMLSTLDDRNALGFDNGLVLPGQSASFLLPITDSNLQSGPTFFLDIQTQDAPEPSAAIGTALGLMCILVRGIRRPQRPIRRSRLTNRG